MALNPDTIVANLLRKLPGLEPVTLRRRNAADAGTTDTAWTARRKPADEELLTALQAQIGHEYQGFELFLSGQTGEPRIGDKLVDGNGVVTDIKHLTAKLQRRVFDLVVLKELA